MTFEIEPAELADADAIGVLYAQVQQLHVENVGAPFVEASAEVLAEHVRKRLETAETRALVARESGTVIGCAIGSPRIGEASEFKHETHTLYLDAIAVDNRKRGTGVGRALVEAFVELARESGIPRVELDTWEFNRAARAFFASLGFAPQRRLLARDTSS